MIAVDRADRAALFKQTRIEPCLRRPGRPRAAPRMAWRPVAVAVPQLQRGQQLARLSSPSPSSPPSGRREQLVRRGPTLLERAPTTSDSERAMLVNTRARAHALVCRAALQRLLVIAFCPHVL